MPKPRVGVVGTDMEWGPMGELMTEKGGPMPLMGELRVLMGECSCPGEPSEEPMPGPREGCSEGAAMEPRPVGEPREEELTWVEKSARQEPRGGRSGGGGTPRHRGRSVGDRGGSGVGSHQREGRPGWGAGSSPSEAAPVAGLRLGRGADVGQADGCLVTTSRQSLCPHAHGAEVKAWE